MQDGFLKPIRASCKILNQKGELPPASLVTQDESC